jgi:hypothetical protein
MFIKRNKEIVTVRLTPQENKYYLRISIGLNIAAELNLCRNQNVSVYKDPNNNRLVGIVSNPEGRYKLRGADIGSFIVVVFAFEEPQGMKLSHTVIAKHKINQNNIFSASPGLIVDISALY